MDSKVLYLAKTLSRTKRKDYENYVVNAVWNRLHDFRLVPVTQQYIKGVNGEHYFIDLYFPQLKIGIECDEGYHGSKEQKALDKKREATIFDVLRQINEQDYTALHVDVTKTWEEVEAQINHHVASIKAKIEEIGIENGWESINPDPADYFKDKTYITIEDNIAFSSNKDVYNHILGQQYTCQRMHSGERWHKLYTDYGYEEGTFPWFPQLTVDNKPTGNGYYNILSKDGTEIYEYTDDPSFNMQRKAQAKYIGKKRVVFTKVKNAVTGIQEYRFVGFFVGDRYDDYGRITYKRIDDKFKIIRP